MLTVQPIPTRFHRTIRIELLAAAAFAALAVVPGVAVSADDAQQQAQQALERLRQDVAAQLNRKQTIKQCSEKIEQCLQAVKKMHAGGEQLFPEYETSIRNLEQGPQLTANQELVKQLEENVTLLQQVLNAANAKVDHLNSESDAVDVMEHWGHAKNVAEVIAARVQDARSNVSAMAGEGNNAIRIHQEIVQLGLRNAYPLIKSANDEAHAAINAYNGYFSDQIGGELKNDLPNGASDDQKSELTALRRQFDEGTGEDATAELKRLYANVTADYNEVKAAYDAIQAFSPRGTDLDRRGNAVLRPIRASLARAEQIGLEAEDRLRASASIPEKVAAWRRNGSAGPPNSAPTSRAHTLTYSGMATTRFPDGKTLDPEECTIIISRFGGPWTVTVHGERFTSDDNTKIEVVSNHIHLEHTKMVDGTSYTVILDAQAENGHLQGHFIHQDDGHEDHRLEFTLPRTDRR
jgi:hypothetical protein